MLVQTMTMLIWPHTHYMLVMICLEVTQMFLSLNILEGYESGESCPDMHSTPFFWNTVRFSIISGGVNARYLLEMPSPMPSLMTVSGMQ